VNIFERRATHPVPDALPPPPADWEPGWRRLVSGVPADDDLGSGYAVAAAFLDPILVGRCTSATWSPDVNSWIDA
jgi:hypothetical protein